MKLNSLLPTVSTMEVIHPSIGKTGVMLKIIGQDTQAFRDKARAIAKDMIGRGKDANNDIDNMEKQNIDLVATCIIGWEGLEDDDGNPLEYSPSAALTLMKKPELSFIKEQVEAFIAERKNFFRQPSK